MTTPNMEQGPAPSIEERAARLFDDAPHAPPAAQAAQPKPVAKQEQRPQEEQSAEPDEGAAPAAEEDTQSSDDAAPTPEELFEIEVDGVKYALPKPLEKAVLQERDYTQKAQSLAEQRKQFELLHEQARIANFRQEFEAEAATEIQQLQAYDAVLKQPVDWASMSTDEAFRTKIQRDQWKDERDAIAKTLQGKHQQFEKKLQDSLKELKTKALETVSKKIPNWSEAEAKALREHAIADGYTEAELNSIIDPRHTLTLWKAKQFDQLKAKATKAVSDVKTVKTTPSNPMPQQVKDKLNFRKALAKVPPNSPERRRLVEDRAAQLFK